MSLNYVTCPCCDAAILLPTEYLMEPPPHVSLMSALIERARAAVSEGDKPGLDRT